MSVRDGLALLHSVEVIGYDGLLVGIRRVFFMSNGDFMGCGIVSEDELRTRELLPLARDMIASVPGVFGVSNQASIFGRGTGQGRTISVNLAGDNIEELANAADRMMRTIRTTIPDSQIRRRPALVKSPSSSRR